MTVKRITTPFKVAAVEFNAEFMELDRNIEGAVKIATEAATNGARLIVLPEAAVSGYIYKDREQFLPFMDTVPGKTTNALAPVCAKFNCYIAIGIAEVDPDTNLTYNTGALIGPKGYVGKYRKNGLNPSDILWFVPGNTGYPVFETELGNITMIICYDDTYYEPARVAALKNADIIAYICSSDRVLPTLTESAGNHSTIAAVQQQCAWNGLAMVAADRSNAESNPTTGISVTYGGAASIWQATGERIAHASTTNTSITKGRADAIIYAELDPAKFTNNQKNTFARRRPELYGDLAFYRAPTDGAASKTSHAVSAAALQYQVAQNDFEGNLARSNEQIKSLESGGKGTNFVVLPAFSFCGPVDQTNYQALAENKLGRSTQIATDYAGRLSAFVVVSFIEKDADRYYHTASLVGPDGKLVGQYRQTHLDENTLGFLTAGEALPVFETSLGRVGMLLNEDVRYPEASGVLSVKRADIIAIPSNWSGQYGGQLQDAIGLFKHPFAANTMTFWYAVAKTSQAYTVVANPVGHGCMGSSGIFTINPIDAIEGPAVGSVDNEEIVTLPFKTLGDPNWWMNQAKLIGGRRADLAAPLTFPLKSKALAQWIATPGFDVGAWAAYKQ